MSTFSQPTRTLEACFTFTGTHLHDVLATAALWLDDQYKLWRLRNPDEFDPPGPTGVAYETAGDDHLFSILFDEYTARELIK